MKFVVTGACGMLGREFVEKARAITNDVVLVDIASSFDDVQCLDIVDLLSVETFLSHIHPDIVVNCAAYTKVDLAETEQELAFAVNSVGPANLARACKKNGIKLVHISSDYVYGGGQDWKSISAIPWKENDVLSPKGIYAHSKRFGDELIESIIPDSHLIVRTSWLYGRYGKNFVHTMLELAKEKSELRVVSDQVGSPTEAKWLADTILKLIKQNASGVFNASSRGNISWFDFASKIMSFSGHATKIVAVSSEEFKRPAPRPSYSTMDVSKLERALGESCPLWDVQLAEYLK